MAGKQAVLWAIPANNAALSGRLTFEVIAAERDLLAVTTARARKEQRSRLCV